PQPRCRAAARAGRDQAARAREALANGLRRYAVSAGRADARGEDRRLDTTGGVDRRAAGVAVANLSANARDRPRDGTVAVGVLAEHRHGAADPGRLRVEGPVAGIAEDRDRGAGLRVDEAERLRAKPGHAQDGHVVPSVDGDGNRAERRAGAEELDGRVVL